MLVETLQPTQDAAYTASVDRELRIITSHINGDSTRRLTESYIRRQVADHAWRNKANVGAIQFWWPDSHLCMALAELDWGPRAAHRAWLLAQANAASLQWANDPESSRFAYHAIELETDHVAILRACCERLEAPSP